MGKTTYNGDIEKLIDDAIERAIEKLKKEKMIKDRQYTAYQKTERVLKNYKNLIKVVDEKHEQIEAIEKYGVPRKSGSIIPMPEDTGFRAVKMESDKAAEAIAAIRSSIVKTEKMIAFIEAALDSVHADKYYPIIELYYFESMTNDEIAAELRCDESTVRRNKSRLVNALSVYLFSDEVVEEIYA